MLRTNDIKMAIDPQQWVPKYADLLYNYAMTRLSDAEQAKDLVQETFLGALERVEQFEGKSSEGTWLTAILKNKIIDVYRKKSSGLAIVKAFDAEQQQQDYFDAETGHWKAEHSPRLFGIEGQTSIINKEFNAILLACLHKLPALWYAVFTMKHMEDLTTDNICSELNVSPSNFWVIIHRAKVNLRACLQKNWI